MDHRHAVEQLLPHVPGSSLVGRARVPGESGSRIVTVRQDRLVDITRAAVTMSALLERDDVLDIVRSAPADESWDLGSCIEATLSQTGSSPRLLSPIDLQVIKAAGVTFAKSMIERVIEEKTAGDASLAASIRSRVTDAIGDTIGSLRPGSEAAAEAKRALIAEGLWSQYLEVGIGPDPEIFTKAPVLSSAGTGAPIGVLARSTWNNPEPEVVLAVRSDGRAVGATLGNDVNLRDFEGRSALLLTEAKDNNGSCAIGPMIRLFDEEFNLADVSTLTISLHIEGDDGFVLDDESRMSEMSRTLDELITHTVGPHHQYPDGFVLFTGTLFAPTKDRDHPGLGFTHKDADIVRISCPQLGTLVNSVTAAEKCPPWTIGITDFFADLAARGLLDRADAGTGA